MLFQKAEVIYVTVKLRAGRHRTIRPDVAKVDSVPSLVSPGLITAGKPDKLFRRNHPVSVGLLRVENEKVVGPGVGNVHGGKTSGVSGITVFRPRFDLDVQIPQLAFPFLPYDAVDTLVVHKRLVDVKAPPEQFGYDNVFLPFAE